jgi:hypothetical protein
LCQIRWWACPPRVSDMSSERLRTAARRDACRGPRAPFAGRGTALAGAQSLAVPLTRSIS